MCGKKTVGTLWNGSINSEAIEKGGLRGVTHFLVEKAREESERTELDHDRPLKYGERPGAEGKIVGLQVGRLSPNIAGNRDGARSRRQFMPVTRQGSKWRGVPRDDQGRKGRDTKSGGRKILPHGRPHEDGDEGMESRLELGANAKQVQRNYFAPKRKFMDMALALLKQGTKRRRHEWHRRHHSAEGYTTVGARREASSHWYMSWTRMRMLSFLTTLFSLRISIGVSI